ncbi:MULTISPECIES: hypothetical protein [unclassified Mesorhizobium]|uniref:hypothetical protein n=1 Tax=unclassified Mesorhizobium TaxID=325217 RepID=UPI000F75C163|nr:MULTISPECIES: hypothetical protein [unclassified Mesorhizobium]AZO22723.1 hypothetical protein EJ070_20055 [Mesorhizobium sp. M1E.F.Ca.ET.045.02.1.1]RUW23832.1 hypothetical protein EOA38_29580 [Mesorhizobium sp. M1E.F.Ca.ET.041.01.1.1]RUW81640.1 hypothetical protein EOA29_20590 [Mesorhizobium sp. M1E.F.Ca.ET.063.01.1.1]RWD88696.1 MAG: hypothetical protein EOS38_13235 [Mesorhizobium sp.]RWD92915.1 MAG: hypothetical protein EOS39_15260 [Mesorhizobium sp.]
MERMRLVRSLVAAAMLVPNAGAVAANTDPDWPCAQRKVPQLSLAQVWNGPDLPPAAKDWSQDPSVSALVEEVAARRLPIADAQMKIRDFAASLPAEQLAPKMAMLLQGMFDHMDAERSHVISGISRYAHRQLEMAAELRKQASDVDVLRAKPDADQDEVERQTDQLNFATRIFNERAQSLTYVCDVPTIIEQRLYQLSKTVSETLAAKK